MTKEQLAALVQGIAGLAQAWSAVRGPSFQDAVNKLVATLGPELPAKDDGTPFTDEELSAAAEAARQPFLEVLARAGGDAPATKGPDGHP
jgi:hypothetical protein